MKYNNLPFKSFFKLIPFTLFLLAAKHTTLRNKSKDWLERNRNNVFEWSDMCFADELGVRPKDVLEMESRLQFNDVTFEISNDEDNSAPERYLTSKRHKKQDAHFYKG
jgi:hypothetical protein